MPAEHMIWSTGTRLTRRWRRPATIPGLHKRSQSTPDLWDTNPESIFSPPSEEPDPAPSGQDDYTNEVKLKDERGRLRLPAYVLITLGIAFGAILFVTVGLLLAPG